MRGFPLLIATALIGCTANSNQGPDASAANTTGTPAAAPAAGDVLTGPVLERLDASPYSYLRIKTAKGEVWAAVPETKVEKGIAVTVLNPMMMTNFESKSLKRTFPEVYFGTLADTGATSSTGDPQMGTPQAVASVVVGKVDKATGADAHTVAETWAQKSNLVGKPVTIRGTVVKYNAAVMGKNWIHLQDGSGNTKQGDNDITVTSLDATAVGQTITIQGTLHANRDFGAGYVYAIIVEDAKVVKP